MELLGARALALALAVGARAAAADALLQTNKHTVHTNKIIMNNKVIYSDKLGLER